MDVQKQQPGRQRRLWRRAVPVLLFSVLVGMPVLFVSVWRQRIVVATHVMRNVLDRQGLQDVSFRLSRLDMGHVVVEDIRMLSPDPALEIGRAELRFLVSDAVRGQMENVCVSGVRTRVVLDNGKIVSPVYERYKRWRSGQVSKTTVPPAQSKPAKVRLRSVTVGGVEVEMTLAGGAPVTTVTVGAGALAETDGHYRVWGDAGDGRNVRAGFNGTVCVDSGTMALNPEIDVTNMEDLLDLARRFVPDRVAALPVLPTNSGLRVRGRVAIDGWTNVGPFEVGAELGRNSTFLIPGQDRFVRFQTLRLEASGTPRDVQARVSAGVSGFRLGGDRHVAQEEGRMLSLRGSVRYRQTATNQWVAATVDSELPGRSVAQALPRLLPLVPKLFTEGGALRAEAQISRVPRGEWEGEARFQTEARRSALTLASGRVGAGRVSVSAKVAVVAGRTGEARTEVAIEEGYFFKRGLSVRGGGVMTLVSQPPYSSASGTFVGQLGETVALQKAGVTLPGGAVRFEGEATLTGLVTNPVWRLGLRVPEFGIAVQKGVAEVQTTGGAAAELSYSATRMAVDGGVWLRDTALAASPTGAAGSVRAGVGHIGVRVHVPPYDPSAFSNAVVQAVFDASNGWAKTEGLLALEGARASVPLTWSGAGGLNFLTGQSLTWKNWEASGIRLVPGTFGLESRDGTIEAQVGVRLTGSALGLELRASVPVGAPQRTEIAVTVPEAELAATDVLGARLREKVPGVEATARVGAEAHVRFLGVQPHVLGRVRVADGNVRKGDLSVSGLALDMPFEWSVFFRTIERPVITFTQMKAGNVRLDAGHVAFQLTPQEVFVDRMEVERCKGSLNAYSVHLNIKNPKDTFVVYADRIDLGEALMMVMPFKGVMEGVLYGRFPVGFDDGHVKLSTGFLYSLPGQGGKLKLNDPAPMVSLLKRAGIQGDVRQPLSKALSDMDFSAIRMELEPKTDGDAVLRMKLDGKSNYKEWPAPVALNLNLHGPLEELLNLGLDVSRK